MTPMNGLPSVRCHGPAPEGRRPPRRHGGRTTAGGDRVRMHDGCPRMSRGRSARRSDLFKRRITRGTAIGVGTFDPVGGTGPAHAGAATVAGAEASAPHAT